MGSNLSSFQKTRCETLKREILTYTRLLHPGGSVQISFSAERVDNCRQVNPQTGNYSDRVQFGADVAWTREKGDMSNEGMLMTLYSSKATFFVGRALLWKKKEPPGEYQVPVLELLLDETEKAMVARYGHAYKTRILLAWEGQVPKPLPSGMLLVEGQAQKLIPSGMLLADSAQPQASRPGGSSWSTENARSPEKPPDYMVNAMRAKGARPDQIRRVRGHSTSMS